MRPHRCLFLLPLLFTAAASAQLPFTITSFNLPIGIGVNSTYTTALASLPGGTALVSGAGLSNQQATVTADGSAARERGLNCGAAVQLAMTFTFVPGNAISVLATAPLSKTSTSATLTFSITGGTGLFQGAGGSGTINGTLNQNSTSATITGSGSGTITLGAPPAPVIAPSGIVPVDSSVPIVQSGSWISIYGSNFISGLPAVWNGDFPTKLGGVNIKIDNKDAFIWFVGPNQINAQVPDDTMPGCVNVVLTNANGTATSQITLQPAQPSFSLWGGTRYAAGFVRPSDGSYVYLGPTTGLPVAVAARPAKAGDIVEIYGVGFGPVAHPVPSGKLDTVVGTNTTNFPVTVTVAGQAATVLYSGLSQAGSYQIDFIIPQVPSGDNVVVANVAAPNPLLFSSFATQNCRDDDPQGPIPMNCNVYIPVQ